MDRKSRKKCHVNFSSEKVFHQQRKQARKFNNDDEFSYSIDLQQFSCIKPAQSELKGKQYCKKHQ